jgi:hypothetical protein
MSRIACRSLFMTLTMVGAVAQIAAAADPPPPATPSPTGSHRFERDGWIYVHLEGSPEQIGFQHGSLLSA